MAAFICGLISDMFNGATKIVVFVFLTLLSTALILGSVFLPVIIAPELVGLDHLIYVITGHNLV